MAGEASVPGKIGGAVTGVFGFVAKKIPAVLAIGAITLLLATSGGGIAALGGAGGAKLAAGATEGLVEGTKMLAGGANWVAGHVGTAAAAAPGVLQG